MAYLEVKNIVKAFGSLRAVSDVSFHVNRGEIVSIIGPNGAGKTTVFNLLTGVYSIDAGQIWLDGQPIHNQEPEKIVGLGLGRTFQNIRLFPNLRVIENVLLGMHLRTDYGFFHSLLRLPRFKKEEAARTLEAVKLLKDIGLGDYLHHYAESLPYGAQRKLEIARAMATGAKILLLDEPAAGMNPQESAELLKFIHQLRERGYTIILIEHDMKVVMKISDRIYVLDHGQKIAEGKPAEIAENENVIRAYLGTKGGEHA